MAWMPNTKKVISGLRPPPPNYAGLYYDVVRDLAAERPNLRAFAGVDDRTVEGERTLFGYVTLNSPAYERDARAKAFVRAWDAHCRAVRYEHRRQKEHALQQARKARQKALAAPGRGRQHKSAAGLASAAGRKASLQARIRGIMDGSLPPPPPRVATEADGGDEP